MPVRLFEVYHLPQILGSAYHETSIPPDIKKDTLCLYLVNNMSNTSFNFYPLKGLLSFRSSI